MTRELAIKIISGDTLGTTKQVNEAVAMAIEALKATQWISFRQRKNPVTGLYEWDEPLPKEGQHILVAISMRGHEPVQDDYWYVDGTICYLDSGYDIGTEAVAWMPLPSPYKGEEQ